LSRKAVEKAIEECSQETKEKIANEKDEMSEMTLKEKVRFYLKNFPLKDFRFLYFIFILIFVQTLFAHNWLTLPLYTSRAFEGFVSENFEFFVNLNPILIFILTPMVTALTSKKNTYTMMIIGTAVIASPTFILALGPTFTNLLAYLIIMTIGEAMWQPRFLQWVAEIAPKNMTGIYMGIGQFPWFLTKVITSLYSGWFLIQYCPADTPPSEMNTQMMWLIYGFIAIISPLGLLLARGWMMKGFKVKHEEK
jgi:MFS family permease